MTTAARQTSASIFTHHLRTHPAPQEVGTAIIHTLQITQLVSRKVPHAPRPRRI